METEFHSFIIRLWNDAPEQKTATPVWRGSIEHVGTGKRLYFSDGETILDFISDQIGCDEFRPNSKWKSLLPWMKNVDY